MPRDKHKDADHHKDDKGDKKIDKPKGPDRPRLKGKPDVHTQERVLRFVNAARVPGDLTVVPHDVFVVDEAAAHLGDLPHHF